METLTSGLQLRDMIALLITNIVAFLLLLALLKKFAWGPILSMLDGRKDKIKADYDAASSELAKAEQLRSDFDVKLDGIQTLERERVQEAVKRGEQIAGNLQTEARHKAAGILEKADAEIDRDVATARLELRHEVVDIAIAAAEKLLHEKLDDAKHRELIEGFIQDLGDVRA